MRSLFMPTSKHFFNRQCGQNRRVFTSILQLPSKIHFVCYKQWNTNRIGNKSYTNEDEFMIV